MKFAIIRHLASLLLTILPPSKFFRFRNFLYQLGGIRVGLGSSICGGGWIYGRGPLVIGFSTWVSPRVIFYTHPEAAIHIGDNCDLGPGIQFIPGSHNIGDGKRRAGAGTAKPITIGNGCWIGAGCLILGGVKIGCGSIVAAGSVVTKDVAPNTLVAGVPAILKRSF